MVDNNMTLPKWNLDDFYSSMEDVKIHSDLENLQELASNFSSKYKTKIAQLSSNDLYDAIVEYENISTISSTIGSYIYLCYSTNLDDNKILSLFQKYRETLQTISQELIFVYSELKQIDKAVLEEYIENSNLCKYKHFLLEVLRWNNHLLSEKEEAIFSAKSITSSQAFIRLYDEEFASIQVKDPKDASVSITLSEALNYFFNQDSKLREQASVNITAELQAKERISTFVYNYLIKDKQISDKFHNFSMPQEAMNLDNNIDSKDLNSLVDTITGSYQQVPHKYYDIKRNLLKLEKLKPWDRNVPIFEDNLKFTWEEAKNIVLEAYGRFSPVVADIAKSFFDNNQIDALPHKGKQSGAYSHSTSNAHSPRILMSFYGKYNDVMTLAHELGHGVHQTLAKKQGELQSSTSLVLAETASIFGEQLVFDYMLSNPKYSTAKQLIISSKIESKINTVYRQIAFHKFEEQCYKDRQNGELKAADFRRIFLETQKNMLGSSFTYPEEYGVYWSYVSHFFHVPFYVYAYAYGDCFVNSLFGAYKSGVSDFKNNYLHILEKGGAINAQEVRDLFKFDNNNFWLYSVDYITSLIKMLEDSL